MSRWYKICCPVDFSETSRAALEEAADLARRDRSELTLVHVSEPPPVGTEGALAGPRLAEAIAAEAEGQLEKWRVEAEKISLGTVRAKLIPQGLAAKEICHLAREEGFDLVVMGTHGRTGLRHLVLGSVAERVVREAHCPVLVVRPRGKR
jgi:nucleotide-binding universal stress UspA family protein